MLPATMIAGIQVREVDMLPFKPSRVAFALALAMPLAISNSGIAATKGESGKKLTYEQAWAFCSTRGLVGISTAKDTLPADLACSDLGIAFKNSGRC
jgi:hypothetical protein